MSQKPDYPVVFAAGTCLCLFGMGLAHACARPVFGYALILFWSALAVAFVPELLRWHNR